MWLKRVASASYPALCWRKLFKWNYLVDVHKQIGETLERVVSQLKMLWFLKNLAKDLNFESFGNVDNRHVDQRKRSGIVWTGRLAKLACILLRQCIIYEMSKAKY